jgi:hypothetical protein
MIGGDEKEISACGTSSQRSNREIWEKLNALAAISWGSEQRERCESDSSFSHVNQEIELRETQRD